MRIAANPYGKKILWPWLKKNWGKLSKKVGHGNPLFNRIVASIVLVADDSMINDIKSFFKSNPTPGTSNEKRIPIIWQENFFHRYSWEYLLFLQ